MLEGKPVPQNAPRADSPASSPAAAAAPAAPMPGTKDDSKQQIASDEEYARAAQEASENIRAEAKRKHEQALRQVCEGGVHGMCTAIACV